jgi:hypothetical protein
MFARAHPHAVLPYALGSPRDSAHLSKIRFLCGSPGIDAISPTAPRLKFSRFLPLIEA